MIASRAFFVGCFLIACSMAATLSRAATTADPFLDGPADAPGAITLSRPQATPVAPFGSSVARGNAGVGPVGNPLWSVPLSSLSATRERPVFSLSRRPPPRAVAGPPVVPVVAAPPPPPPPEPLMLAMIGAVVSDNEAIAVFFDRASQGVVRLRAGQAYGGWMVNSVLPREVTLTRGNQTETIGLPKGGEASATMPGMGMSAMVPGVSVPGVGVPGVGVPGVGVPGVGVPGVGVPGVGVPGVGVPGVSVPAIAQSRMTPASIPSNEVPVGGVPGVDGLVPGVGGPSGYAPYVPRSTPRDGKSDGL